MSKTSKNVLGDQRGKIGKVVGKVVDGVQMYSAHTDAVNNPKTPKQIAHRARFAAAVAMGKAMKGAIKIGLRDAAAKRKLNSAFNIFVKRSLRQMTYDAGTGVVTTDYQHVEIAEGETPFVTFTGVTFNEALKVTVTYSGNGDIPGALADDSVYVVIYAPALGGSMMAMAARSAGTMTVELPAVYGGETVHVWGFVRTAVEEVVHVETYGIILKPGECSGSSYVGTGTVLAE